MANRTSSTLPEILTATLYQGPVFEKLDRLRSDRPDLAPELDDLARALRDMADRVAHLVDERSAA